MADRKAASVLPEPVGAMTSAFSPCPIAAQARSCTAVGPVGKASENQVRVACEKFSQPGLYALAVAVLSLLVAVPAAMFAHPRSPCGFSDHPSMRL